MIMLRHDYATATPNLKRRHKVTPISHANRIKNSTGKTILVPMTIEMICLKGEVRQKST